RRARAGAVHVCRLRVGRYGSDGWAFAILAHVVFGFDCLRVVPLLPAVRRFDAGAFAGSVASASASASGAGVASASCVAAGASVACAGDGSQPLCWIQLSAASNASTVGGLSTNSPLTKRGSTRMK